MRKLSSSKAAEILAQICLGLSKQLEGLGMPAEDADLAALNFMDWLRREVGGQQIYFPKCQLIDTDDRDKKIFASFQNGERIHELVRKYGLSSQKIYQVISEGRARSRLSRPPL